MLKRFCKKKKYRYKVGLHAEGSRTGTIDLTKEEAEIVAYATNPKNWKNDFWVNTMESFGLI